MYHLGILRRLTKYYHIWYRGILYRNVPNHWRFRIRPFFRNNVSTKLSRGVRNVLLDSVYGSPIVMWDPTLSKRSIVLVPGLFSHNNLSPSPNPPTRLNHSWGCAMSTPWNLLPTALGRNRSIKKWICLVLALYRTMPLARIYESLVVGYFHDQSR